MKNPIALAGGLARKKQNPDYSAMGKKGGWPKGKKRKKKINEHNHPRVD